MNSFRLLRYALITFTTFLWLASSLSAQQAPWFLQTNDDTHATYRARVEQAVGHYEELLTRSDVRSRPDLVKGLVRHLELLRNDLANRGPELDMPPELTARLERAVEHTILATEGEQREMAARGERSQRGPATAVAGAITDKTSGEPIEGAIVYAWVSLAILGSDVTDENGDYFISLEGVQVPISMSAFEPSYLAASKQDVSIPPNTTGIVDWELQLGGSIAGSVTSASSSNAIASATVEIYNDELNRIDWFTAETDGSWHSGTALDSGNYFVRTLSVYRDEAYDNQVCEPDCDLSLTTPVAVQVEQLTTGIDFVLEDSGHAITGRVTDSSSGEPITGEILLYDSNGNQVQTAETDDRGHYALETGSLLANPSATAGWYVLAYPAAPYLPELYGGAVCHWPCDALVGDLIVTTPATTTDGVDVFLDTGAELGGDLSWDLVFGSELPGIEIYDDSGSLITTRVEPVMWSPVNTIWTVALEEGDYYVRTRSSYWQDRLFDGFVCDPECDVTMGTKISVTSGGVVPSVDMHLRLAIVFISGFEGGTTTEWSSTQP